MVTVGVEPALADATDADGAPDAVTATVPVGVGPSVAVLVAMDAKAVRVIEGAGVRDPDELADGERDALALPLPRALPLGDAVALALSVADVVSHTVADVVGDCDADAGSVAAALALTLALTLSDSLADAERDARGEPEPVVVAQGVELADSDLLALIDGAGERVAEGDRVPSDADAERLAPALRDRDDVAGAECEAGSVPDPEDDRLALRDARGDAETDAEPSAPPLLRLAAALAAGVIVTAVLRVVLADPLPYALALAERLTPALALALALALAESPTRSEAELRGVGVSRDDGVDEEDALPREVNVVVAVRSGDAELVPVAEMVSVPGAESVGVLVALCRTLPEGVPDSLAPVEREALAHDDTEALPLAV
jgi:hypothetical protein